MSDRCRRGGVERITSVQPLCAYFSCCWIVRGDGQGGSAGVHVGILPLRGMKLRVCGVIVGVR